MELSGLESEQLKVRPKVTWRRQKASPKIQKRGFWISKVRPALFSRKSAEKVKISQSEIWTHSGVHFLGDLFFKKRPPKKPKGKPF